MSANGQEGVGREGGVGEGVSIAEEAQTENSEGCIFNESMSDPASPPAVIRIFHNIAGKGVLSDLGAIRLTLITLGYGFS